MYAQAVDEDPHERRFSREVPEQPKAFSLLGARDFREAWQLAERELERARKCGCCATLLAHVYDRLGSDLFLDDDPGTLVRAFDASDRDPFSERVLAARIVTSGRMRVGFAAGEWDS
jgi:hypothetical protein